MQDRDCLRSRDPPQCQARGRADTRPTTAGCVGPWFRSGRRWLAVKVLLHLQWVNVLHKVSVTPDIR